MPIDSRPNSRANPDRGVAPQHARRARRGRALLGCTALLAMLAALCLQLCSTAQAAETQPAAAAPADVSPLDILERSDRIRFPQYGFQVDVVITTTRAAGEQEVREYRLLSKGNTRTLVQTTAPAIDRGQILLMRDKDLWAFLPSVSQPVRLPLSQKLTGQVANGDLARANFVGDYNPELLRTEEIDGEKMYVLELTAAARGVTYQRVVYWVNAANFHPYKAEFYTISNRLMKTCLYTDFKLLGDEIRPTRLVMEDALRRNEKSELVYSNMAPRDLPDKVFNKDYLKKLAR